jgi:hypothetical protein
VSPRIPLALVSALLPLTLFVFDVDAQTTGGSFGGSRWGSGARPARPTPTKQAPTYRPQPTYRAPPRPTYIPPPQPTYRPQPVYRPSYPSAPTYPSAPSYPTKTYPTKNWGSTYNPNTPPPPPPPPASSTTPSGSSGCCGSSSVILFGLMAAVTVSAGKRRKP